MASIPQHDTDGFDPQRIVWRMVDQPLWFQFVQNVLRTPRVEPNINSALARVAWLCEGRVDL